MYIHDQIGSVPGAIVESGVHWGYGLLIHLTLSRGERKIVGFDSFAGHSMPTAEDRAGGQFRPLDSSFAVTQEDVLTTMRVGLGRNWERWSGQLELVSGWIQHTVPAHVEGMVARGETIALVHADCDIYEPMKATILGCWPALAPGGIIVVGGLGNAELAGKDAAIADFRAEVSEVEFELDFVEVLDQGMKPTKQWFIRKRRRP